MKEATEEGVSRVFIKRQELIGHFLTHYPKIVLVGVIRKFLIFHEMTERSERYNRNMNNGSFGFLEEKVKLEHFSNKTLQTQHLRQGCTNNHQIPKCFNSFSVSCLYFKIIS